MSTLDTDVIIVGGGPSGLMLANELGRRNVRTILLDQDAATSVNPQANATQARTMEHYRRLGFVDEVRAEGLPPDYPTDAVYFTTFSKFELARFALPAAGDAKNLIKGLGGSWSAAELPHRVSQMYVEKVLHRHAAALPSNDLRYEHEVTAVADHGDHVTATAVHGDSEITLSARYLIGCDGPRSVVRRTLGISYAGESEVEREFVGGDMYAIYFRSDDVYPNINGPRAWMHVNINHQRRCFLVALNGIDEFVFHTQLKDGEDKDNISDAQVRAMFAQCMGCEVEFEIISHSSWRAGFSLVAEKLGVGRMFIAGDAAHLFTPTGGLGYNTAIEDAVNLGWKIAAVINGWGGDALLASYHLERHPGAVRNTTYARGFADSLGGYKANPALEDETEEGARIRAETGAYFEAHSRAEFNIPGITFGTRFDDSPVIVQDNTPPPVDQANTYTPTAKPGGRAPHAWLDDGTSLFDKFGFEFTLLKLNDQTDSSALEQAAAIIGVPMTIVTVTDVDVRQIYEADLALIRPDQSVAWRGDKLPEDSSPLLDTIRGAT